MTPIQRLRLLRWLNRILLLITLFFVLIMKELVSGLCLGFAAVLLEWRLYRCPFCRARLDAALPLREDSVCPHCRAPLGR